ncbi:MAG: SDR family oxidoreductase [Gammaproteobacteria bacterium]|nr:SDR family oxidoreductase [Gammaproteobacteria bacterium]
MEKTPFESVFIFGCGDIGQRVAHLWLDKGLLVYGLARSAEKQSAMVQLGLSAVQADLDEPASLTAIPELEQALVYWFVPPPQQGQVDPRMQNLLAILSNQQKPVRIIAISTTGIYGDQQGRLVDEDTPPNPQVDRARRRLDMETQLRTWGETHNVPVIILRVGGIYGPDRLPLRRIRDGVPVLKPELSPKTNRIHADDLARVCVAAATRPSRSRIYNVSDGQDSDMTEYFFTLADFFGLPRPPEVDWAEAERSISPGMLSYLRESRRLDTQRMRQELGVELRYPSLLDGLRAMQGA